MAKLYCTDLFKRAAGVAMKILGLYGQLDKEDRLAPERGWFEHAYLSSYAATIAAGTSEIQKNIIAIKELDLPRL
jgi:alkylation response protein AidB-like acyl-CoA dehydrogenase